MKCISIQRSTFHLNRRAKHNTSKKKKKNARDKCRSTVRKIWQCEPKWSIIFYVWLYLGIKLSAGVFHGLLIKIFAHSINRLGSTFCSSIQNFNFLRIKTFKTVAFTTHPAHHLNLTLEKAFYFRLTNCNYIKKVSGPKRSFISSGAPSPVSSVT